MANLAFKEKGDRYSLLEISIGAITYALQHYVDDTDTIPDIVEMFPPDALKITGEMNSDVVCYTLYGDCPRSYRIEQNMFLRPGIIRFIIK